MVKTVDITGWSKEEKNMIHAAVVALLFAAGITYTRLQVVSGVITLDDPSSNPSLVINDAGIRARVGLILSDAEAARLLEVAEESKREAERVSSPLAGLKMDDVNARIDSISNIAEVKVFLKVLLRNLVASGRVW